MIRGSPIAIILRASQAKLIICRPGGITIVLEKGLPDGSMINCSEKSELLMRKVASFPEAKDISIVTRFACCERLTNSNSPSEAHHRQLLSGVPSKNEKPVCQLTNNGCNARSCLIAHYAVEYLSLSFWLYAVKSTKINSPSSLTIGLTFSTLESSVSSFDP